MKKSFLCSLICPNGIIGGTIYIENKSIMYLTNKLTVDSRYKNILLPINQISEITWKQIIFPIATFQMKNGEKYKAIIFNKKQFIKTLESEQN